MTPDDYASQHWEPNTEKWLIAWAAFSAGLATKD